MSNLDRDTSPKKSPILNPILHSATLIGPDLSSTTLLPPEPKSLVTLSYGESSTSDSENLDEINLSPDPENLGPPAIIDTNSNSLLVDDIQNESLLSQAASSFSALPAVASSVLSTFSKRIYAVNNREQTSSFQDISNANVLNDSLLGPQNLYTTPQQIHQQQQKQVSAAVQQQESTSSATTEANVNFLQSTSYGNSTPPEPPKLYAPTEVSALAAAPRNITAPPSTGSAQNSYRLAAKKKLYAPIPGLSGHTPQLPNQVSPLTALGGTEISSLTPNLPNQAPPNIQIEQKGGLFSLTSLVPNGVLQNITGLVQTAAGTLSQSIKSEVEAPTSVYEKPNVAPSSYPTIPEATTPTFFATQFQPADSVPFIQSQIPQPGAHIQSESNDLSQDLQIPTSEPSAALPVTSVQLFPTESLAACSNTISTPTNVNFFQQNSTLSHDSAQVRCEETTPLAPPPSSGQVSFRLQKGTRLYKNPLSSKEIAPSYVNPQQHELNSPLQPPVGFNSTPQSYFQPQTTPIHPNTPTQSPSLLNKPKFEAINAEHQRHSSKEVIENSGNLAANAPYFIVPTQEADLSSSIFNTSTSQNYIAPLSQDLQSLNPFPTQSSNCSVQPTQLLNFDIAKLTQEPLLSEAIAKETPQQQEDNTLQSQKTSQTSFDNFGDTVTVQEDLLIESFSSGVSPIKVSNIFQAHETKEALEKPLIETFQTTAVDLRNQEISTNLVSESKESTATVCEKNIILPPPPSSTLLGKKTGNPYRKSSFDAVGGEKSLPSLASFFTPSADTDNNLSSNFDPTAALLKIPKNDTNTATNFFVSKTEQKNSQDQEPETKTNFSNISNFFDSTQDISTVSPAAATGLTSAPTGLETFVPQSQQTAENISESKPSELVDSFNATLFSGQTEPSKQVFSKFFKNDETEVPSSIIEHSFFDSFAGVPNSITPIPIGIAHGIELNDDSSNSNEDQKIQNFFNNPPPKENSSGVGDLNYDLVHSGLGVRAHQTGSLTTASNIVEPPSSSICSEISEANNFAANQRLLPAKTNGTSTDSKAELKVLEDKNETVALSEHYTDLPEAILEELRNMASDKATSTTELPTSTVYTPAVKHWFYKRLVGQKHIWTPFSHYDSALLETSLTANHAADVVSVQGGRYDVNVKERIMTPVYWEGQPIEVRRCSWFFKASDSKYVPYDEDTADRLEEEYRQAAISGAWHKKIILPNNEQVVFHGPAVIVHFQQQQNVDAWGGTSQKTSRPRVVKRDLDDFTIEMGESMRADHLLLMVHGIGSACDLKMRSVEEVVDDFRSIAQQLVQSHYKNSMDMGIVGRVEVLPISWHSHLHSEEMGIDEKLKSITLESIPKLRSFTNDTLLDVLFYTSPIYCQKIVNRVATEMNTLYLRYRERHPDFSGGVSLAGHSLGSLILFDLLCHQQPIKETEEQNLESPNQTVPVQPPVQNITSQQISYTMGPAGTGQPYIQYAQLVFHPKKFFALGSPIGMFVTIRGIDKLGLDFRLPTCPGFYNIFHPFDPVAYRIEALVNPDMSGIRPVLIPHHKGRKRMHLELKETMTRVGADLKQRFLDTFKTTLDSVNFMGSSRSKKEAQENMEKEVDQVIAMQMEMERDQEQQNEIAEVSQASSEHPVTSSRSRANSNSTNQSEIDIVEIDLPLGKLNDSRRVDYVLQEAPLEFFNEYIFALSSHVCYWDSSDTILFVMKEIYSGLGISPDSQIPQQTMSIERPSSRNSVSQSILPPSI